MGGCGWRVVGGVPPHMCAPRVRGKHDNFMQMAASIGFFGNPWEFPMMSYVRARACTCVTVHACVLV